MFVLSATALAMLTAGSLGALLPVTFFQAIGMHVVLIQVAVGLLGGIAGLVGAYMLGDRLNDRLSRLRAPIGSAAIGSDGIRWRHFGKTEFLGWSSVRDIEQRGQLVVVHGEGRETTLVVEEAELFADAARRALQGYRNSEPAESIAALELAGENVGDWLARSRRLLEGGSYRDADIGEDHCVRVAIDPRAPITQRIGSAAALSTASDEARQRVRVAIEETADPEVANALADALEARGDRAIIATLTTRK